MRTMTRMGAAMTTFGLLFSGSLAFAEETEPMAPNGGINKALEIMSGKLKKVSVVSNSDNVATTSTIFVDVPDMTLPVNAKRGPIVISFSAQAEATDDDSDGGAWNLVKAQVDGVDISPSNSGNNFEFAGPKSDIAESHNAIFHYNNETKGLRTITIQWRTSSGDTARFDERTLVVQYR